MSTRLLILPTPVPETNYHGFLDTKHNICNDTTVNFLAKLIQPFSNITTTQSNTLTRWDEVPSSSTKQCCSLALETENNQPYSRCCVCFVEQDYLPSQKNNVFNVTEGFDDWEDGNVLHCAVSSFIFPEEITPEKVLEIPYQNSSGNTFEGLCVFSLWKFRKRYKNSMDSVSRNSSEKLHSQGSIFHNQTIWLILAIDSSGTYPNETVLIRVKEAVPRAFNVTGFVIGMLPPMVISFYIIFKLGYRSRYAEERAEEEGVREEPFFVSY
ncbi:uncharacterized protein LOC143225225 isoform X2 [Tachypleus tridentatus]|uniref:uncharacterized protein LOC143225225 isoform X2 n=1 Tax=Tachypleus tridentatus TaxID=6853 RepID=UPI003FD15C54